MTGLHGAILEAVEHPESFPPPSVLPAPTHSRPSQSPSCNLQQPQELFLLSRLLKLIPTRCHLVIQLFPLVPQALKPGLYVFLGMQTAAQQLSPSLDRGDKGTRQFCGLLDHSRLDPGGRGTGDRLQAAFHRLSGLRQFMCPLPSYGQRKEGKQSGVSRSKWKVGKGFVLARGQALKIVLESGGSRDGGSFLCWFGCQGKRTPS